jgi:hypothetical protein
MVRIIFNHKIFILQQFYKRWYARMIYFIQQPYYSLNYVTNIYEAQFSSEIFYSVIPSNILKKSLSSCVKLLRESIDLANKVYAGIAEDNLVIIGNEADVKCAIKDLSEMEAIESYEKIRSYHFSGASIELKLLIAKVMARCLLHLILLQAYNCKEEKWTVLSDVGKCVVFDSESLVEDLEDPFKSVVNIYKGLTLNSIAFRKYKVLGESKVKIGIVADYTLAIIPAISIGKLIEKGFKYEFNKFLELREVERKIWHNIGYRMQRYFVWELEKEIDGKFLGYRYEKGRKKEEWRLNEHEFNLNEIYPLRKPEVIDQILSKKSDERLTIIVKRLSFQITEDGKKDLSAPYKRFEATKVLFERLHSSIKGKVKLGDIEITISKEPCIVRSCEQ